MKSSNSNLTSASIEQTPMSFCRRLFRQKKANQQQSQSSIVGGGKSSPTETSCADASVSFTIAKNSHPANVCLIDEF